MVLSVSLAFEFYKKVKKNKAPEVILMPPRVGHFTVQRTNHIAAIGKKIAALRKHASGTAIVYLVGPSGIGKSEVAFQYAEEFASDDESGLLKTQRPVVLFLNGATPGLFETTLREAAMSVGVKDDAFASGKEPSGQRLSATAEALRSKLRVSKQSWLIVVDNLRSDVLPGFRAIFTSGSKARRLPDTGTEWDWNRGAVLVTTQGPCSQQSFPEASTLELAEGVSHGQALELLRGLAGEVLEEGEAETLVKCLRGSPLALALAAATINIYRSSMENEPSAVASSPLTEYTELLAASLPPSALVEDVVQATLSLYTEAAVTNPRIRHTFDLLGSCAPHHPVPAIVIARHLTHSFYGLPLLTPPPFPSPPPPVEAEGVSSYLQQLKAMIPFMSASPSDSYQSDLAKYIKALEDQVPFLRDCPLLAFKKYHKTGVELVHTHPVAYTLLPRLFSRHTAPGLDHAHLKRAENDFNRTAWFRRYRTFDPSYALQAYHRSLPGLSAVGVLTENQFKGDRSSAPTGPGAPSTYSKYAHLVSHSHRVISSLTGTLKSLGGDMEDMQLKNYLQPHFRAASSLPFLSTTDRLSCSYSLVSIEAFLSSPEEYPEAVRRFHTVLDEQRAVLGSRHPAVARTLTDIADLKFSLSDPSGAKQLLESAVAIYEKLPKERIDAHALDIGLTLASLGLVLNGLGEKSRSCQLLEQALGYYQVVQPDGNVTNTQRKLVASTLIDVAHTYLSLGDISNAKKYIDLANLATHNIYQGAHPETIRALNVMSIVYALLGDKPESRKVRQEAGKLKNQLDTQPMVL